MVGRCGVLYVLGVADRCHSRSSRQENLSLVVSCSRRSADPKFVRVVDLRCRRSGVIRIVQVVDLCRWRRVVLWDVRLHFASSQLVARWGSVDKQVDRVSWSLPTAWRALASAL